jgi:hypothetical protein
MGKSTDCITLPPVSDLYKSHETCSTGDFDSHHSVGRCIL